MSMITMTMMGNLTRDPETKFLPSGMAICELSIAVEEWRKDKENHVNYFDLVAYGGQAEAVQKHFTKGKPILVTGRARQERWTKDDQKRSKVVFVVERWYFAGGTREELDLFTPVNWATLEWDLAMKSAVRSARYVECERTGSSGCSIYKIWGGQQDDTDLGIQIARSWSLPLARGAGAVGQDPDLPRHQGAFRVVLVAGLDGDEERRLQHVFRFDGITAQVKRDAKQFGRRAIEDLGEQLGAPAVPKRREQLRFVLRLQIGHQRSLVRQSSRVAEILIYPSRVPRGIRNLDDAAATRPTVLRSTVTIVAVFAPFRLRRLVATFAGWVNRHQQKRRS